MADTPKDRVRGSVDDTELHLDEVVSDATGEAERHAGGTDDQSIGRAEEGIADAKDYAEDLAEEKDGD
jgi:uncharacterized protein YjbJ (UPF0337 family)